MGAATVLYVDPDQTARDEVARRLAGERSGLTVETAASRDGALATVAETCIDCVITEYDLGDGDGLDLYGALHGEHPGVPVVIYTDSGSERVASEALRAGVSGYVPKSAGVDLLLDRIDDALRLGAAELATSGDPEARTREDLIVEQAPVGIVEWDLEFTVTHWNPEAERIFGYDAEEAEGTHALDLIVPEDVSWTVEKGWERLLEGHGPSRRVNKNVRADGSYVTCEWLNAPLSRDGEVVAVVSFVQEVTEREQRRRHMDVVNRVLRHDVRNGMNVVIGCAESLAGDSSPADRERWASMIVDRATDLVEQAEAIRTLESVFEGDRMDAHLDLADVAERTARGFARRHPDADVELSIPERAMVRASDAVPDAIEELLENTVEHCGPAPTVEIAVQRREETVRLTVADDGPGIPDDERVLVDGDREITQLHHASGVGLWLADRIVELSGGSLSVESDDSGTRVRMDLPAADGSDEADVLRDGQRG